MESLRTEIRFVLYLVSETLLEREECVFSMNRQLAEAWGQFLSQYPWDWFVTLTFREPVGSFRAHRLFGYFVRDLEKAAGVPIFWFRADEIGPNGGRFHIHALVGNVENWAGLQIGSDARQRSFSRILSTGMTNAFF